MKKMLSLLMLISPFAQAESLHCLSDDKKYEIHAELDLAHYSIPQMNYLQNGNSYREFKDLEVMVLNTGPKAITYKVMFDQFFYYFEFQRTINEDGSHGSSANGVFIPKNFPLSAERLLECEIK